MSIEQQVDNVSADTLESSSFDDTSDFFSELDASVNGAVLESSDTSKTTSQESAFAPLESPAGVQKQGEYQVLQKRYSDSSREGKRLNTRLTELEPYVPIIDAMKEDPDLVSHVRGYFEGGGKAPKSMKDKLKLPEDFVFDPDDAVGDSSSDSAKVLDSTIDGVVQRRMNNYLGEQKRENARLAAETEFRKKFELGDDEWKDLVQYAKSRPLELEDIYYLKTRNEREKNIANSASTQVAQQMKSVSDRPQSLATSGSQTAEATLDDKVFDTILGADSKMDQIFNMS